MDEAPENASRAGTAGEVFGTFLRLGLTSFGGPVAHLGYFRTELVLRRRWLDERAYADLIALCQFLPGPASSQVGFALGLRRAGLFGALAAWTGFTLPSAILLVAFAYATSALTGPIAGGLLHGLKLVAVAVVAQAVWGMARSLAPDRQRAGIALAAVLIATFAPVSVGQIAAIGLGGLAGLWLCRQTDEPAADQLGFRVPRSLGIAALTVFTILLVAPPLIGAATKWQGLAVFDAFYRSGALVFGGGHVVLPLLQAAVVQPGWVSQGDFLAGYGAAQAVPGPLFTFAAYLGTVMHPWPNGIIGAIVSLAGIFLPGLLLLVGTLPFWDAFRRYRSAQAAMRGANAAVVGILAAALYDPIWTNAVLRPADFAIALAGFLLLTVWKVPPWVVVVLLAATGLLTFTPAP
ncbi:MAG TPA: chromate efflux transporter [Devosia sp.]|nr:chromate efflux transporter [Devosia sp.]